jgi:hypothetical protein
VHNKFGSNKKFEYNYDLNENQQYILKEYKKKKSNSFISCMTSLSVFSYFFIKKNLDYNKYLKSSNNEVQLRNFKNSKRISEMSLIFTAALTLRHIYLKRKYTKQKKSIFSTD